MEYNFSEIEKKWQNYWEKNNTFKTNAWDFSKPKFYCLDMFPYPSGEGLHVGHPEGYTATDIISRMKRMQGYNVLHPMGFDAFGLPAEQYAIKTNMHPKASIAKNIKNFTRQLKMLGFSYDWDRSFATSDEDYFKWTQYIVTLLYKSGFAYIKEMPVMWCEALGTVLANDEIVDGKSERGGYPVERKFLKQWVIDITKFADRLLKNLDTLDFPASIKKIATNWIGKSEGITLKFDVVGLNYQLRMYTTRPDTVFGITFVVVSPEHELIKKFKNQIANYSEVEKYVKKAATMSDLDRTDGSRPKTGVELKGIKAYNPFSKQEVPIFVGDYVLGAYGEGAVIAVPAGDQRDYDFAKKLNLKIVPIMDVNISNNAHEGDGTYINSDFLNGITNKQEGIKKASEYIVKNNLGEKTTNYRMREWIFARQRYWGEPMPFVYDNENIIPLELNELPLNLPMMEDFKPRGGFSPLERVSDWVNVKYNGKMAKRETSTMPGSAGSSWYYLRYIDPHNSNQIADPKLIEHWMPVDLYLGGAEHATGHLLYSRMWNMFLHDKGISSVEEPYKKLVNQGMILGENGEKMSKSRGNVINPDDIVKKYGADSLRLYEMFMGPLEMSKPWSTANIEGIKRFLDRVFRLVSDNSKIAERDNANLEKVYNQTVKKVTEDFTNLAFNTAISQLMIFVNACYKEEFIGREQARGLVKMLYPIAPHIGEELWQILGGNDTITYESWPTYDESKLAEQTYELIVQVNGKLRAKVKTKIDTSESELKDISLNAVKSYIEGKTIVKTIVVKNRLVNIVVKD